MKCLIPAKNHHGHVLFRAIFSIATGITMSNRMKKAQKNAVQIDQQLVEHNRQQAELLKQMVRAVCGKWLKKQGIYHTGRWPAPSLLQLGMPTKLYSDSRLMYTYLV